MILVINMAVIVKPYYSSVTNYFNIYKNQNIGFRMFRENHMFRRGIAQFVKIILHWLY